MDKKKIEPRWFLTVEWLTLLVIVALATTLRYWRLGEVPPGFNSDEAVGAVGALTTLREGLQYSYEGQGGGGALGFYFAAAAFYLFGPSIESIRGLAAWAGVVSVFVNYWAIREVFRSTGLGRARWIAGLSTLGLAVSLWHVSASRIAFAGIGVPFLMLPSVLFLWQGLNHNFQFPGAPSTPRQLRSFLPFIASGIFLGGLMYIYLSGVFFPPFYALFFIGQWLVVKLFQRLDWPATPAKAFLTTQFWYLFATGLTAALLLLPIATTLLFNPEIEPGATRVSQASFLNPQINQGDPWGLLWRSITGNFGAYGISLSWLSGQLPARLALPGPIALMIFLGFLMTLWQSLRRGRAADLFMGLWFCLMLLPSILSPDQIPHNLRAIGATTPAYTFAAIFIVGLFETLWAAGQRWLQPALGSSYVWLARGAGLALGLSLLWLCWQANALALRNYFFIFPETNEAKAAYHVYAVEMAEVINREPSAEVAFILPRNTAAGEVYPNYTTDFLTALKQPLASHYWVVDNEHTLARELTTAAAKHSSIRVVEWKTSKHTGADPKEVIPYYLEKYGHYHSSQSFEYFEIHTYKLDIAGPNFQTTETTTPTTINFAGQIELTGYALGDAGNPATVAEAQAASGDLLWLRLNWRKTGEQPEDLKVSAQIHGDSGQLVTQIDKQLVSNILQVSSSRWPVGAEESTYFLIRIPPATPPGHYRTRLAVYGSESLTRLEPKDNPGGSIVSLTEFWVLPARRPVDDQALEVVLPIEQELLPGLSLIGFETLPGESVRTGQEVGASLIWQAGAPPPSENLVMAFLAKAQADKEWTAVSVATPLAGADYPSTQWQPGELLRGWLKARIPPSFQPGPHELKLRLSLATAPDEQILTLPIGDFEVTGWPRTFEPPEPELKIGATYDNRARLVGLDGVVGRLSPGESFNTRLYWRAEAESNQDYTVFFQLLGPDGRLYGQVDQQPGAGTYPTSGWLPGEYVTDDYTLTLAADAPPGDYQLAIGLYDPYTGQRLPVTDGNCQPDVCLLPSLSVRP